MSIPPLVCSTPPPPEQCEDDKDQEDFDLNYHLSQEVDESNDYDYDNFSSFDHFKSTTSKACQKFDMSQDGNIHDIKYCTNDENREIKNTKLDEIDSSAPLEDDILEDLNLKIDNDSAVVSEKNDSEESDAPNEKATKSLEGLQTDIPVNNTISQPAFELRNNDIEISNVDTIEEAVAISIDKNPQSHSDKVISESLDAFSEIQTCDINATKTDEIMHSNITSNDDVVDTVNNPQKYKIEGNVVENKIESDDIDEFEDFDDFQFVSSNDKPSETVFDIAPENPWQNDVTKSDGFGDFTANFGEIENATVNQTSAEPVQTQDDADDDFGDFDEFKSVNDTEITKSNPESSDEISVLNFQSSESEYQIIERINKIIHTIYQNEITETENISESKLEGSLGETWGYLRETDIRQPYIVNWNNSLAQKTLLKALCIDSRNILFGPKWSSMPKYAATLSTAPLQPQKQLGQSNVPQSETNYSEKNINKTWTDPFTSNGQESCHTDNDNTVIETGPTDLDVFEAAISTKPDKIYSNTIGIQPMRQINLPDTHIFTPTNSETPRSKTIHYDNPSTPTVLMPQSAPDKTSSQSVHSENDSDYWEFQDFRGVSDNKTVESGNEEPKNQKDVTSETNLTIATQVLQPIKLEPIMPSLNWPDPGEVKETFDDFSDFMSNIPASNEKQEALPQNVISSNIFVNKNDDKSNDSTKEEINQVKSYTNQKLDDEFDMFQSALPSLQKPPAYEFARTVSESKDQASSSQVIPNKMTDFDAMFSKVDTDKSENISHSIRLTENVLKNENNPSTMFNSKPMPSTTVQMANANVLLQPSIATSSVTKQSQQKASQILQPLSLESYSQINWPNPGIDLQDLSRFNPVESLQSLKTDSNSQSKTASPVHSQKMLSNNNQTSEEDIWGEFVSSKPKQQQIIPKKQTTFADDEEWTDFVSSPSVNPQNGLNTISLNVHTNSNMQKSSISTKYKKANEISLDIPALNYITPKSNKSYNERHFQDL